MQFDRIRRREFITLLGGATAAWPLAVRAQQPERMRRIGVLDNQRESDPERQSEINAFRQRLNALGWSEGRAVRIDVRHSAGDLGRLHGYAAELVTLGADVILGTSTPTIAALRQATRTIPIVFVGAQNPVGSGFVASLARPNGNITGFVDFEATMGGKWLETLREVAPGVRRVALIYNPESHTGQYFQSIEDASRSLAIKVIPVQFREAADLERSLGDFASEPNCGFLALPDTSTTLHRDLIVKLAAWHQLPAVYPFRFFITSGGLAYYGSPRADQFPRAAEYVDRILRGAKPADLPVQAPTKYELVINLKTAKALGLDVPPMLLARADEVIE
jgi:putative ABC transport system substrate-binding protein